MNRIKEVLKEKGISINELAEILGVSRVTVSTQINGTANIASYERIAAALNVPMWQLFARPEETAGKEELNALITHRGKFYEARTLEGLKDIVKTIEANS